MVDYVCKQQCRLVARINTYRRLEMFPVRCYTCGKVLASLYNAFARQVKEGISIKDALTSLGVKRYCCNRHFVTTCTILHSVDSDNDSDTDVVDG
jgi:DNA-directed RNA polymerase subunit N